MKDSTFSQNFIFKSQDWEENDKWVKVRGVASDESTRDLQGELIKVSGADLSYVGLSSMLSWEHNGENDSSVFIGPIDKATKEGGKLIIEGRIMKNLKQGRNVIDLMKAMKDMGREMQLSVEGKVLKRNPIDKKIIERWKFTHCALTLLPQNRKTSLSFSKSENKKENIFDHTDPKTGKRVIVKADKSIEVIEKTITAENIETKKEDLEDKPKYLSKSEVINYILGKFEIQDDLEKAEKIFEIVEEVRVKQFNEMKVTEEIINKAQDILKKAGDELAEELKKSESPEEKPEEKKEDKPEEKKEEVKKSEEEDLKKSEEEEEKKKDDEEDEAKKSFQEGHQDEQKMGYDQVMAAMKKMSPEDMKKMDDYMSKKYMKKSEEGEDELAKKKEEEVKKSEEKKEEDLKKSEEATLFEQIADLVNNKEEYADLKKSLTALNDRLQKVENTPIQKSIDNAQGIERFKKSEDGEELKKGEISITDRKAVSDALLDASGIKKGERNDVMLKAVQIFESTGNIDDKIKKSLAEDHNIVIKE